MKYSLNNRTSRLLKSFSFYGISLFINATLAFGQSCPVSISQDFAVLGGSAVSNTGTSMVTGNLGVSPGSAITGLGDISITGTVHQSDAVAAQAQDEITIQYNMLAGLPFDLDLSGIDLGGLVLTPAVYHFSSSAQLTGTLTLDTLGDPEAIFVFQIGSTLTTASASVVNVIGGPDSNIFWQVGSSATLGTTTDFSGQILASASITLNTGASIECGSVFARSGAVTMDSNTIAICDIPCISCEETNNASKQFILDATGVNLRDLLNRVGIRILQRGGQTARLKSYVGSLRKQAEGYYLQSWQSAWAIPSITHVCSSSINCIDVSHADLIADYSNSIQNLYALVKQAVRKLRRVTSRRSAGKAYLVRARAELEIAEDAVAEIPVSDTLC